MLTDHVRRGGWSLILMNRGGGSLRTPLMTAYQLCTGGVLPAFPFYRGEQGFGGFCDLPEVIFVSVTELCLNTDLPIPSWVIAHRRTFWIPTCAQPKGPSQWHLSVLAVSLLGALKGVHICLSSSWNWPRWVCIWYIWETEGIWSLMHAPIGRGDPWWVGETLRGKNSKRFKLRRVELKV